MEDGLMHGEINRQRDVYIDTQQMDSYMDGWMDGWMDEWMNR
jgi:hypothetical protein